MALSRFGVFVQWSSSALEALSLLSHSLHEMKDKHNHFYWPPLTESDTTLIHQVFYYNIICMQLHTLHRNGAIHNVRPCQKEGHISRSRSGGGFLLCGVSFLKAFLSIYWFWVFQSSAILTKLDQPLAYVKISSSCCSLKVALQREASRPN